MVVNYTNLNGRACGSIIFSIRVNFIRYNTTVFDDEFESVVTDLEIVGIAAFGWVAHSTKHHAQYSETCRVTTLMFSKQLSSHTSGW